METTETKILIVEDETLVSLHLKRSLENLGYKVSDTVGSGEKALNHLSEDTPDLILMDIMLDGKLDGISTSEKIKSKHKIPIVYLSAYSDNKTLGRAKLTEPSGYLTKPFKDQDLKTTIELALHNFKSADKKNQDFSWILKILNSANCPLLACDPDGIVQIATKSIENLFEVSPEKFLGSPLESLIEISNPLGNEVQLNVEQNLNKRNMLYFGWMNVKAFGKEVNGASVILQPLINEDKELIGGALVLKKKEEEKMEIVEQNQLNNNLCELINQIVKPALDIEMCPWCKKIYDPSQKKWVNIEIFIRQKTIDDTSHCICPGCATSLGLDLKKIKKDNLN